MLRERDVLQLVLHLCLIDPATDIIIGIPPVQIRYQQGSRRSRINGPIIRAFLSLNALLLWGLLRDCEDISSGLIGAFDLLLLVHLVVVHIVTNLNVDVIVIVVCFFQPIGFGFGSVPIDRFKTIKIYITLFVFLQCTICLLFRIGISVDVDVELVVSHCNWSSP
jgi:hypothetical protein